MIMVQVHMFQYKNTEYMVVTTCSAGLFVQQLRTEGDSTGLYTSLDQTEPSCPHGTFP